MFIDLITKTLSAQLAPQIRIISIAPGMLTNPVSGSEFSTTKEQAMIETTPMGRIGTPEDVADVVESYVTNIKYATGSIIILDGGRTV